MAKPKTLRSPRVATYQIESDEYELLKRYYGLKGMNASERIRQLLKADIDSARRTLADLVEVEGL